MVALRNCEVMRPHTNSESGAIFWHFPLVTPTKMGKLQFGAPKPAVICATFDPSRPGQCPR